MHGIRGQTSSCASLVVSLSTDIWVWGLGLSCLQHLLLRVRWGSTLCSWMCYLLHIDCVIYTLFCSLIMVYGMWKFLSLSWCPLLLNALVISLDLCAKYASDIVLPFSWCLLLVLLLRMWQLWIWVVLYLGKWRVSFFFFRSCNSAMVGF